MKREVVLRCLGELALRDLLKKVEEYEQRLKLMREELEKLKKEAKL